MLIQLWNDWEIQILVLLSFLLQVFLFCSGGLRRRRTNSGLRLLIWLAYFTADLVAVYALGLQSRQNTDTTTEQLGKSDQHQLTFFWAPFLLIHLGGQDTVTAFSVEDNELWLRHLLNLLVQVGLALYVFWKSEARNHLLFSAVFVFVVGIIKYGERTLALKSASQKDLGSSTTNVQEEEEEAGIGRAGAGAEAGAGAGSSSTDVVEEGEEALWSSSPNVEEEKEAGIGRAGAAAGAGAGSSSTNVVEEEEEALWSSIPHVEEEKEAGIGRAGAGAGAGSSSTNVVEEGEEALRSSTTIVEEEEEEAGIGRAGAVAGSSTTNVEEEEAIGSQKALELKEQEQELGYMAMVKFALSTSPAVRNLFSGRKLEQMEERIRAAFTEGSLYSQASKDGELVFKILEIELGMMYDNLYTKAMVTRTLAGTGLRIVTLICLMVAFGLFLIGNKQWPYHNKADVAITYTLFAGSFCLEVCAIFLMVMMSTWTWALFRSWKWQSVSNAIWHLHKTVRPVSRPLWSNSMGQYNFLHSHFSNNENVIGKMMTLIGAKELLRNFRHTRRINVPKEIKKLIFEDKCFDKLMSKSQTPLPLVENIYVATYLILRKPFEEAIISLHIYTDIFLHQCIMYTIGTSSEKLRHLSHICRTLSEYMCFLLVVHPDMLPITGSASDVLDKASDTVTKIISYSRSANQSIFTDDKHLFLERMAMDYRLTINLGESIFTEKSDPVDLAGYCYRSLSKDHVERHPLESLQVLVDAWLGVLLYASGKSHGDAHAKHLSIGGELLTFIWLHLAHLSHGDMGTTEIELIIQPEANPMDGRGRKKFIWWDDLYDFLW